MINTSTYSDRFLQFGYFVFFLSLVFAFRGYASIGIGLILLAGLIQTRLEKGTFINPNLHNSLLIACTFYFSLQLIFLLIKPINAFTLKEIQLKTAIILVPLAVYVGAGMQKQHKKLMRYYILMLTVALSYCVFKAGYKYFFLNASHNTFFYHNLLSPFKQHAVQVSILLFIGLIHLMETGSLSYHFKTRLFSFSLGGYFAALVLLLSSKLVIIFTILYLLYFLLRTLNAGLNFRRLNLLFAGILMLVISFVLLSPNPVSRRFREAIQFDMSLVKQKVFHPGIYFNGVEFRLLQARFVKEILNENNAWFTGVSSKSQHLLNEKYINTHMYIGDGKADPGYTRYNTHNQFLESLLQLGIPGLMAYCFICFAMIKLMVRRKSPELFFITTLLLAYSLNESVLERQYAIMIFLFFPLFIYYGKEPTIAKDGEST